MARYESRVFKSTIKTAFHSGPMAEGVKQMECDQEMT